MLEREGRYDEADAKLAAGCAARSGALPGTGPDRPRCVRPAWSYAPARCSPTSSGAASTRSRSSFDDLPPDCILTDEAPPLDPELLGLFVGTALDRALVRRRASRRRPRILLFKRNLERFARDEAELTDEIARTLHHELAHYLGFAEEDMVDLDLD